jgi:hypothetical protein
MDDNFKYFLSKFGPVVDKQEVSESALNKYRGVLPDQLLQYWQEVGWSGFAKGLYWLVDPDAWDDAMEMMLEPTGFLERDAYHVIARNAFGDLWLWGKNTGRSIKIRSSRGMIFPSSPNADFGNKGIDLEVQITFASTALNAVDLQADDGKPLFERAHKKLGPLKSNEVYGFVPLPAMGGACDLKCLQKLEAFTYMDILAQNTPMRVMPDYVAEARKQGLK